MPDETIEQEIADLQTEEQKVETEIAEAVATTTSASASEAPLEQRVSTIEALLEKHGIRQAE